MAKTQKLTNVVRYNKTCLTPRIVQLKMLIKQTIMFKTVITQGVTPITPLALLILKTEITEALKQLKTRVAQIFSRE